MPPAKPLALEEPARARAEPRRCRAQSAANEKYVTLVEEAKALLAPSSPRAGLEEIHLRALRALVAELQKQKAPRLGEKRARLEPPHRIRFDPTQIEVHQRAL